MPQHKRRIRRLLSLFMLYACSLAVVGLLIVYFGTHRRSWERAIATEPQGWPWSFCSPIIDPQSEADSERCVYWHRARVSGWRVGSFNGRLILARNRSLPQSASKEMHFYEHGIQVAHGTVFGPYYYRDSSHFSATCAAWIPEPTFQFQTAQGKVLNAVNTTVIFSAWVPVPFLAAFPIYWFLSGPWRTYRRRRKGLCIYCAYNLTGNTSGTCPECGMHCPSRGAA